MFYLRKLKLINFTGYQDFEIDLTSGDSAKKWIIFYGPNGIGKSNFLNAVRLLAKPWELESRLENKLFFRRLTYNQDYIPNYEGYDKNRTNLYMEAVFATDNGDKRVVLENNWNKATSGVTVNELPEGAFSSFFFVDADNRINMQKFQMMHEHKDAFLDFAEAVYGLKCELPEDRLVEEYDKQSEEYITFCTDLVITKYNGTRVHFKRMSDGEKKIATTLTELFTYVYKHPVNKDIILFDNIELHIYFKRHMILINKMKEHFPNKQIIATTHSPVIIDNADKECLYDLEEMFKNKTIT